MLSRLFLAALILVFFHRPASAQFEQGNQTVTTQPKLAKARVNEDGQLVVKTAIGKPVYREETRTGTITKYRSETRLRKQKVTRDGQTVEENVPYTVQVPYQETVEFTVKVMDLVPEERETVYSQNTETKDYYDADGQALAFFETNGQAAPAAQIGRRLKNWEPILVTSDGKPAEDFYTAIFKPGTLVVALPPAVPAPTDGSAPHQPAPKAPADAAPAQNRNPEALDFLSKEEKEVLERTNQERAKAGKPALKANARLSRAARSHALNMAKQEKLSHTLDDKTFDQRIEAMGYQFTRAGENISNAPTAADSLEAWMDSPGHRENILNPDYREIGIGQGVSPTGQNYWVQVFAAPLMSN
jgi:uncharacterized protein YkwD